jgi:hypothetical protein
MTEMPVRIKYEYGKDWSMGWDLKFADELAKYDAEHNVWDGSLKARLRKETGATRDRHWTHFNGCKTIADKELAAYYEKRRVYHMAAYLEDLIDKLED